MPTQKCDIAGCEDLKFEDPESQIAFKMLERHDRIKHPQLVTGAAGNSQVDNRKLKILRPAISERESEQRWETFKYEWDNYKKYNKLTTKDEIVLELQQCCDARLRQRLCRDPKSIDPDETEVSLLNRIKSVAVQTKSTNAHMSEFLKMKQDRGELFINWVGRLKEKAALCKLGVSGCKTEGCQCTHEHSLSEFFINHLMIDHMYNQDHRCRILASTYCDTYDKRLERAIKLEETDHTTEAVQPSDNKPSATEVRKESEYRRMEDARKKKARCKGCRVQFNGTIKMRDGSTKEVEKCQKCWQKEVVCRKCKGKGHYAGKCTKATKSDARGAGSEEDSEPDNDDDEDSSTRLDRTWVPGVSQTFKADAKYGRELRKENNNRRRMSGNMGDKHEIVPGNLEWDRAQCEFTPAPAKEQPFVKLNLTVMSDQMRSWHCKITRAEENNMPWEIPSPGLADTGAQTMSGGRQLLARLGLQEHQLLKTRHRIVGAGGTHLGVLGAVFLRITNPVNRKTTRAICYICENEDVTIFSRTVCEELGVVRMQEEESSRSDSRTPPDCSCPPRTPAPPPPSSIPFEPVEENVPKLEAWLLEYYSSSGFNVCPHQPLQKMEGKPLGINFKEGAEPKAIHTPVPVPYHWKNQVKADIDRDVRLGIIEPVPVGTPVTWLSRMVVAPKKDGSPRRTVDLQRVNAATKRETHHTRSPHDLAISIPPKQFKTTLDAWNGYHALPLDEEAKDATSFITEWGRYRYKRAPQGFHASGDGYTRRCDDIITAAEIDKCKKCVDDACLHNDDIEGNFWSTVKYIDVCSRAGIVFNPDKFVFGRREADFAGFTVKWDGYAPTKKLIEAIENFPLPTNLTGIRSWFGLIQQVSYCFSRTAEMKPFRAFLARNKRFDWPPHMTPLFYKTRQKIADMVREGVKGFVMGKPTLVAGDWSETGIGFSMQQKHCNCPMEEAPLCGENKEDDHWKLILAGSRFTKPAEANYSPIEGEALAMAHALESTRMFTLGNENLIVGTDHKPLVPIMGLKNLEDIKNPRIRNFKDKTLMFSFRVKHIPGKHLKIADATSRNPVTKHSDTESEEMETSLSRVQWRRMDDDTFRTVSWEQVREAAALDDTVTRLNKFIREGFPEHIAGLDSDLRPLWNKREGLYTLEGVPMFGDRLYVPQKLRGMVLDCLHSAHQGKSTMAKMAEERFFWPHMHPEIGQKRDQCRTCDRMAPSQSYEESIPADNPTFPFEDVAIDFFSDAGMSYIAYCDRYSGFLSIHAPSSTEFGPTAAFLRTMFQKFGVPVVVESDGGPPFNGEEWKTFLNRWQIRHRLSSAMYPESNSRAEIGVRIARRLIADNSVNGNIDRDEVTRALLQYLNTPLKGLTESPAQIIYGRKIRDSLPSVPGHPGWRKLREAREMGMAKLKLQSQVKLNNRPTKTLPQLAPGQTVLVQNQTGPKPNRWERTGTVIEALPHRQYTVKMDGSGRLSLRNRKFLKPTTPFQSDQSRPATSSWSGLPPTPLPPTLDNMDIAEEATSETPVQLETDQPVSPQPAATPARHVPTPRRTTTAVPRRLNERANLVADGCAEEKNARFANGTVETGSTPIPTSERQPRRSTRSRKPPTRLGFPTSLEDYDCSETLVIRSRTNYL